LSSHSGNSIYQSRHASRGLYKPHESECLEKLELNMNNYAAKRENPPRRYTQQQLF